ncbi:MAG: tyrosine-type recombinase/integrase, partial [Candidatus Bathyarchaeota archaeon]|nr:tyrosine-type recombinase/integrase [Candidatus Bathyarchaeota archaeon]
MVACPECGSSHVWKDGLRWTSSEQIQRWLCRDCGYRFSEKKINNAVTLPFRCRISATETSGARNLVEVETRLNQVAGADSNTKGKIVEYAWKLKKRGLAPATIKGRIYKLRQLVREGADLMNPDSISTVLALSNWTESNKKAYITTYKSFAKTFNLTWTPPRTRVQRKLPFIPTEAEVDQLIAACGKKTAAFLQVLKDTGARSCEASKLKWIDIDQKRCTIRINNPAKGSLPRVIKVSPKTIAMIQALPRTKEYIFNPNTHTIYTVFARMRNRLAKKLQNPRLKQIHFHTLRHWKATMEYHKTKDILHVKRLLGHKKLENTEIYTHLIDFESDEWHVAHAKDLNEENKLIEAGFEYVRYSTK